MPHVHAPRAPPERTHSRLEKPCLAPRGVNDSAASLNATTPRLGERADTKAHTAQPHCASGRTPTTPRHRPPLPVTNMAQPHNLAATRHIADRRAVKLEQSGAHGALEHAAFDVPSSGGAPGPVSSGHPSSHRSTVTRDAWRAHGGAQRVRAFEVKQEGQDSSAAQRPRSDAAMIDLRALAPARAAPLTSQHSESCKLVLEASPASASAATSPHLTPFAAATPHLNAGLLSSWRMDSYQVRC